jgi:hypothetical protein
LDSLFLCGTGALAYEAEPEKRNRGGTKETQSGTVAPQIINIRAIAPSAQPEPGF